MIINKNLSSLQALLVPANTAKLAVLVVAALFILSSCVTEQFDARTGEPIDTTSYDRVGAGKTRMSLGLEYIKAGDMVNAKYNLEKAEEHLPDDPEVLLAIAYFYEQVKNYIRAEDYYERAIDADSSFGDSYNNFGTFLCRQKQYERAEKMFIYATELSNYIQLANSFENAGLCAREAGDLNKALRYLEQAIAYDNLRPLALLSMAQVQLELNDYPKAQYFLTRFSEVTQPSADSIYTEAKLHHKQKNMELFLERYALLVERFPGSQYIELLKPIKQTADKEKNQEAKQALSDSGSASTTLKEESNKPAIVEPVKKEVMSNE